MSKVTCRPPEVPSRIVLGPYSTPYDDPFSRSQQNSAAKQLTMNSGPKNNYQILTRSEAGGVTPVDSVSPR